MLSNKSVSTARDIPSFNGTTLTFRFWGQSINMEVFNIAHRHSPQFYRSSPRLLSGTCFFPGLPRLLSRASPPLLSLNLGKSISSFQLVFWISIA
jgi:hypothetical protein